MRPQVQLVDRPLETDEPTALNLTAILLWQIFSVLWVRVDLQAPDNMAFHRIETVMIYISIFNGDFFKQSLDGLKRTHKIVFRNFSVKKFSPWKK